MNLTRLWHSEHIFSPTDWSLSLCTEQLPCKGRRKSRRLRKNPLLSPVKGQELEGWPWELPAAYRCHNHFTSLVLMEQKNLDSHTSGDRGPTGTLSSDYTACCIMAVSSSQSHGDLSRSSCQTQAPRKLRFPAVLDYDSATCLQTDFISFLQNCQKVPFWTEQREVKTRRGEKCSFPIPTPNHWTALTKYRLIKRLKRLKFLVLY